MATILDLLMALNRDELPPIPTPAQPVPMAPAPTGNVPEYGGPSQVTEPPEAPLDTRIIQQMLALRGPAPTAPAPLSRGQRIANALIGFGAGVEGRGGQFLQQLQEPQRQYQRQLENYNQQGAELGVRGLETAQRQQERQTARARQVADREFEAELNREARRLHLTDQREVEMFRDTLLARRQREDDERAAAETRQKEKAQQERDARNISARLGTGPGAAPAKIADELGRFYANLTDDLSPAAEKWRNSQAVRADILARRTSGGGGTGTGGGVSRQTAKLVQEFNAVRDNLITATARADAKGQKDLRLRLGQLVKRLAGRPGIEAGYGAGQWPYVKVNGVLSTGEPGQQPTPQGQQADPLGIR